MLDHFIIEEIKKRQQDNEPEQRPFLELPIPEYDYPEDRREAQEKPEPKRVIIIEL